MEYYFIKESCESEIGDNFPQSFSMQEGYDYDIPCGVYEVGRYVDKLPDFEPIMGKVILAPGAKLTDVISTAYFSSAGFVVNQKALSVFTAHKLPLHKAFPLTVVFEGNEYPYFWLHLASKEWQLIDFGRSKYMKTSPLGEKIGDIPIYSYDDFIKEQSKGYQGYSYRFEWVYIYSNKIKLDLFSTGAGLFGTFVSEVLKNSLENSGIVGFRFVKLPPRIHFE